MDGEAAVSKKRWHKRNITEPLGFFQAKSGSESFQLFGLPDQRTCIFRGILVRVCPASAPV
jgi:hypothetical protein